MPLGNLGPHFPSQWSPLCGPNDPSNQGAIRIGFQPKSPSHKRSNTLAVIVTECRIIVLPFDNTLKKTGGLLEHFGHVQVGHVIREIRLYRGQIRLTSLRTEST